MGATGHMYRVVRDAIIGGFAYDVFKDGAGKLFILLEDGTRQGVEAIGEHYRLLEGDIEEPMVPGPSGDPVDIQEIIGGVADFDGDDNDNPLRRYDFLEDTSTPGN